MLELQLTQPGASPRALSLRANFSWSFIGNVVYAACQWGILIVLAKLASPEAVGRFALGLAVTAPVIMMSNLQLRGALATDARLEYHYSEYLTLRMLTTAAAFVAVAAIVVLNGYARETGLIVLAVALAKSFESISDISYGVLQHQEHMDRIACSLMMRGVIALFALWAGVYFWKSVAVASLAMAGGWAIAAVFDLRQACRVARESRWRPQPLSPDDRVQRLSMLTVSAVPLGIVVMLLSLNVNVPRYVIQHYRGEGALGMFAVAAYLMVAGTTTIGALGQSASPRLAQYYAAGNLQAYWGLMRTLLAIAAAMGLIGILIAASSGRLILTMLFTKDYAGASDVLAWIMVAGAVGYIASVLGYGLTAARRFAIQAPLAALVTGVTATASVLLIPHYGLVGAAWATTAGTATQAIGSGVLLHGVLAGSKLQAAAGS